ncbi:MAG: HAMP domain-containing protein [Phycisphaerales bacterium]|nr:HAMP domain-containing protein [Phycisphaerales bacterium]
MTLRRRLIILHSAFAVFTVLATLATVFGVQFYVDRAARRLESLASEGQVVESLRIDLKNLDVHLHEVVAGQRPVDDDLIANTKSVLNRLAEVARYSGRSQPELGWISANLSTRRDELERSISECIELVRRNDLDVARHVFRERIEDGSAAALDQDLQHLRSALDSHRRHSSGLLFSRNGKLLTVSLLVAASGVGLVVAGAIIVRRRLVAPIAGLVDATEAFAQGDLAHRASIDSADELGALATSLNTMAASLRESQLKFKSLFENLRDAVIVCEASGRVIECHDNDSAVLGPQAASAVGRPANEVWPGWNGMGRRWDALISRVLATNDVVRVLEASPPDANHRHRAVDVVAYPVRYTDCTYVAIVLRDVTERQRLQQMSRHAETMEASVTVARGIAHDFKNLLHCAVNSLTQLEADSSDPDARRQAHSALTACEQAASLARRLSRFAGSDRGMPERLPLSETVQLIVEAMDDTFREALEIQFTSETSAAVEIDRDHLTQIVLNLLINAREAMPDGGTIQVKVTETEAVDPMLPSVPRPYVVLTLADTGCGIPVVHQERIFQPFFTSKSRGAHGPRGMGLAVVYAAVKQAGGFVSVESEPNKGTAFHVHLPTAR